MHRSVGGVEVDDEIQSPRLKFDQQSGFGAENVLVETGVPLGDETRTLAWSKIF